MRTRKDTATPHGGPKGHFLVVHPLDDVGEEKIDTENAGPMPMTVSVRLSLLSVRAYLIVMTILVVYHVLELAGLFHHGY